MELISLAHLGMIAAFTSSLTWAVGSTVYARLAAKHSAFAVNFSRAFFALPLFALFEFLTSGIAGGFAHFLEIRVLNLLWFLVSMIASYGLGDLLFYRSTAILGVPGALAVASTFPVYNLILATFFLGEALSPIKVLGVLVTVVGVVGVIVSGRKASQQVVTRAMLIKGVILSLVTGLFWALNALACSRGIVGLTPFVGNTLRMFFAMIVITVLARGGLGRKDRLILPKNELVKNGPILILESFGGSLLFVFGLKYSPLAVGSVLASLAPVLSVPIAWVTGSEKPSFIRFFWVATVVAGVCSLVL